MSSTTLDVDLGTLDPWALRDTLRNSKAWRRLLDGVEAVEAEEREQARKAAAAGAKTGAKKSARKRSSASKSTRSSSSGNKSGDGS